MKPVLILAMLVSWFLISCNNEATVTVKDDSVKTKLERLDDQVDSGAERVKDSAKARWKEIRDKVEERMENSKDTNTN
jgi:hypothetical protein